MVANRLCSTENLAVSPLPARSLVVLERAMASTTPLPDEERPGRDTTLSACGGTDKRLDWVGVEVCVGSDYCGSVKTPVRSKNNVYAEYLSICEKMCFVINLLVDSLRSTFRMCAGRCSISLI